MNSKMSLTNPMGQRILGAQGSHKASKDHAIPVVQRMAAAGPQIAARAARFAEIMENVHRACCIVTAASTKPQKPMTMEDRTPAMRNIATIEDVLAAWSAWGKEHFDRGNKRKVWYAEGDAVPDIFKNPVVPMFLNNVGPRQIVLWHKSEYFIAGKEDSPEKIAKWIQRCNYQSLSECPTCFEAMFLDHPMQCPQCAFTGCMKCFGSTNSFPALITDYMVASRTGQRHGLECRKCHLKTVVPKLIEDQIVHFAFLENFQPGFDMLTKQELARGQQNAGNVTRMFPERNVCNACGRSGATKRCPCVMMVMYCNETCQRADFANHKKKCSKYMVRKDGTVREGMDRELLDLIKRFPAIATLDENQMGYRK